MGRSNVGKKRIRVYAVAAVVILVAAVAFSFLVLADQAPVYTAAASTAAGEQLTLHVEPVASKPSAILAAWRVGTTQVVNVTVGLSVTVSGVNVACVSVTYYVRAACGGNSVTVLSGSNVPVSLGVPLQNTTTTAIDAHLQALGVSVQQDETVTYSVYCSAAAVGAVSGQTLTATVPETTYATVTYDYGGITTQTVTLYTNTSTNAADARNRVYYGVGDGTSIAWDTYVGEIASNQYDWLGAVDSLYEVQAYSTSAAGGWAAYVYTWNVSQVNLGSVSAVNITVVGHGYTVSTSASWYEFYVKKSGAWTSVVAASGGCASDTAYSAVYTSSSDINSLVSNGIIYAGTGTCGVFNYVGDSMYAYVYCNYAVLQLTVQSINWNLSWSWLNAPLSLVALPLMQQLLVFAAAAAAVFMLTLYLGGSRRGRRGSVCVAAALTLLAAFAVAAAVAAVTVHAAASPTLIPAKWRVGDEALYLLSFPFPQQSFVNGTLVESPATVAGDVNVVLVCWNVTADTAITVAVDNATADVITGEGYYTLTYKLAPGSHCISVYSPLRVFDEGVFYVVPPPPPPAVIPLSEFLAKLEEQRNTIVLAMLGAAAAGVPAGVWTKRKTKVRTDWVFPVPAACMAVGYWQMPTLYMLLPFGVSYALTYWLCRDYADYLGVIRVSENSMETSLIARDDDGKAIVGISPRYWRDGFIRRKQLMFDREYLLHVSWCGARFDCVIAEAIDESDSEIHISCNRSLAKALTESHVVEQLDQRVSTGEYRILFYRRAMESLLTRALGEIAKAVESQLDHVTNVEETHAVVDKAVQRVHAQMQQAIREQETKSEEGAAGENA